MSTTPIDLPKSLYDLIAEKSASQDQTPELLNQELLTELLLAPSSLHLDRPGSQQPQGGHQKNSRINDGKCKNNVDPETFLGLKVPKSFARL